MDYRIESRLAHQVEESPATITTRLPAPCLLTLFGVVVGLSSPLGAQESRPNIVIIWGDDIGQSNVSAYSMGLMGYQTPNIDRVANAGMIFTDYYAEQSCTAGRASFITGQHGLRTGLTKVGMPVAALGLQKEDPTIATLLKEPGYATGQFGKNHLGDKNEYLPRVNGRTTVIRTSASSTRVSTTPPSSAGLS